jgi:hypothetical protein
MGQTTEGDELQERAEHAADKVADPDRLLPGEEPATTNLDDIDHWLSVYSELLGFKQRLVDTTEQAAAELDHSDAQAEVADTDLTLLEGERKRLWRRLRYWQRRKQEAERQSRP